MSLISVSAPTRIADLGGWTDTWFARHGVVCHLAVWPGVEVRVNPFDGPEGVEVRLLNFGRGWHWSAGTPAEVCPDPLIGACLDEAAVPEGAWQLEIGSQLPPGASMGGSASVCVAVLAALDALRIGTGNDDPRQDQPHERAASLARRAHRIETVRLRQQSGVQDQWAAAAGGINLIQIDAYPEARCTPLVVSDATRDALEARLLVVLLGQGHESWPIHARVVETLADAGPDDARLEALRACAREGAAALRAGDLPAYGAVLTRNTGAQAALHASLVGEEALAAIDAVRGPDTLGWKVNGAGGPGGSVTLLASSGEAKARLRDALARACPWATPIAVQLADRGAGSP